MRLRQLLQCNDGSMVLETALSLLVTLPVVFCIFEICMMSYTYATLNDAARQGVRYAISHGATNTNCSGPSTGCTDQSATNVKSVVQQEAKLSLHNMTNMTVTVNYLDSSSAPSSRVQVTITYPYAPFMVYPAFTQTVNLSAEGRIVF